jgi:hypothetical protein
MKWRTLNLVAACSAILFFRAAASVFYVNVSNTVPASPFTTWATAATNIQDAIDVSSDGGLILVTNGVYKTGGRVVYGFLTNRVVINKAVTVQSVNGPAATVIEGYQDTNTIVGDDAVRCVYLTNNAVLIGFTLTNGATRNAGDTMLEQSGGGAWCESTNAIITNCVLMANAANYNGGRAEQGTLNKCTLTGNSISGIGHYGSYGGGADSSILNNCDLAGNWVGVYNAPASAIKQSKQSGPNPSFVIFNIGGGVENSTLNNCKLSGNAADGGGGADSSTLNNCIVTGNHAVFDGGVSQSTLNNCTVTGNSAYNNFGGIDSSTLNNCIVYYNTNGDYFNSSLNYCCTAQSPGGGIGNITNEPTFVNLADGNLRLQTNSPCINAGNNTYVTSSTDLDGRPRIVGGTVDIGAYEFQSAGMGEFIGWLQQYGLSTSGSADYADSDGDGMNNWQEWIAGTNPTNAASVLKMLSLTLTNNSSGVVVSWQSVTNITYCLQRSSDLMAQPAFSSIQSNIVGQIGTTSFTDSTATNGNSFFYRVGVQ